MLSALNRSIKTAARVSVTVLRILFPNYIISKNEDVVWPAGSPDLPDFFLWGLLKSEVHVDRVQSEEVARITLAILRRVAENLRSRLQECVDRNGARLSSAI